VIQVTQLFDLIRISAVIVKSIGLWQKNSVFYCGRFYAALLFLAYRSAARRGKAM